MEEEPVDVSTGLVITPETVANRTFTSAFRGYHPAEVKQFLQRVGDELAAGAGREVELRRALQEALNRAAHPDLDEATVTTVLGEHAARLLASARETAASITAEAEGQADALLRDAATRVARLHDEAEGLLARRLAEADAATDSIQQAAEADVHRIAEDARREAAAIVEAARQQGKQMVAEARDVRERMLADLNRRRRVAQVQVEQLRAARERLLAAYEVVRRTVDEATTELSAAETEARIAADAVARRAEESEPKARRRPAARSAGARSTALVASAVGRSAVDLAPTPGPAPALFRRLSPDPPPAPDRPPLRPQAVADALGRNAAAPPAPTAPSLPPPAPTGPEPAPEPPPPPVVHSDVSTAETPGVSVDAPSPPATGNGNGNGNGAHTANTTVDDLFARIRADRSSVVADRPPAAAPEPPEPPERAPATVTAVDPVSSEHALAARDELLDDVEPSLARALKRVLQDEENELLDRLRRQGSASAGALPDPDAQRTAYRVAALPWLRQAAGAGVTFAGGARPAADAEQADPPLDGLADDVGAALVDPLRERLARLLEESDDPTAAAESVRAAYRQWKVQHVEESARHHVLAAFALGAFSATGDGTPLQWLVDDDGHCPDCDDNALAGAVAKGQPFPTGHLHPPAHHGCRCLLVPAPPPPA